mmetsp:Transcript_14275/g.29314  ORF Transcript_14275/g.29314 Transcript_14275/m.29314 type:complete len:200 (-) Transcript_14275:125-724(-)
MRAKYTPLGTPCPRVPNLYRVVPPSTEKNIRIIGMEFDGEDTVAVSRSALWAETHSTLHLGHLLLVRFVVYAHAGVLSGGCKLSGIATKVNCKHLVVLLLEGVKAFAGSHVPVLDVSKGIRRNKDIFCLHSRHIRSELHRSRGQSNRTPTLEIVGHATSGGVKYTDSSVAAACGQELPVGGEFDGKDFRGVLRYRYRRL